MDSEEEQEENIYDALEYLTKTEGADSEMP